jgi:hypothetical protein
VDGKERERERRAKILENIGSVRRRIKLSLFYFLLFLLLYSCKIVK